jgi:23S rRNA-/tRNA-specific pseudouridylate synthase
LESRLREQLGERSSYLAFPHRLDRPVSGVLIVALRKKAARLLSEQFAARKVEKEYLAVVSGKVDPSDQTWTDFVQKVPDQPLAAIVSEQTDGTKQAETRVEVARYDESTNRTVLRLFPETGRMHQLRIQASHRGHPILGDELYGGEVQASGLDLAEDSASGIMLQAHAISFYDPRNGRRTRVTASDRITNSV